MLFYHEQTILYPPSLPIPGDVTEIRQKPIQLPDYMGQTIQSMCKLFSIAQEIAVLYYNGDDEPICDRVPLAFAEAKYQKLLAWMDTIDDGMARNDHCPSHVVIFQSVKVPAYRESATCTWD